VGFRPNYSNCPWINLRGSSSLWLLRLGREYYSNKKSLVQAFEAGSDLRPTRKGVLVSVTGVTLLHELTHWADAKDGVDDPVPGDPSNEEGNAFELEVYGRIIIL